jgi:hypothetical protein
MIVHIRNDGSEFIIRLENGRQIYDYGKSAPHLGAAIHLIEKEGGRVERRPVTNEPTYSQRRHSRKIPTSYIPTRREEFA